MKKLSLLSLIAIAISFSASAQSDLGASSAGSIAATQQDFTSLASSTIESATITESASTEVILTTVASSEAPQGLALPPAVPEPTTCALVGAGLVAIAAAKRRRSSAV